MAVVDFFSKEVLGARVVVVDSLPADPGVFYFSPGSVVYDRSGGRFYASSGEGWAVVGAAGDIGAIPVGEKGVAGGVASYAQAVGGAGVENSLLVAWVEGGAYEATDISFDSDGVVTTAVVRWPDGSAGVFTATAKDATWFAVNSYTISHADSGKTVTQAAVARDIDGNVTTKAALTVA